METRSYKVYKFDELTDNQKELAIEKHADINVTFDWWEDMYYDAERVGLKLDGFGLDRNRHCSGDFIEYADDTAKKIISEHGPTCETFGTATNYLADVENLGKQYPVLDDGDGYDDNEQDRDNAKDDIDAEFLRAILEDYSIMLQKEYEYLTSEKSIIETFEANDYDFTVDGDID